MSFNNLWRNLEKVLMEMSFNQVVDMLDDLSGLPLGQGLVKDAELRLNKSGNKSHWYFLVKPVRFHPEAVYLGSGDRMAPRWIIEYALAPKDLAIVYNQDAPGRA